MAWESRRGTGRYYTRSRRKNGRVIREYCGKGLKGETAAIEDRKQRRAQREERKALARLIAKGHQHQRALDVIDRLCSLYEAGSL